MVMANAPMGINAPSPGNAVRQTPPGCQRYAIILRSKLRCFHPFAGLVITRKPSGTEPPLSGGVAFQSSLRVHRGQTLSAESDVDRKSVVKGKSVSVRVDLGGRG